MRFFHFRQGLGVLQDEMIYDLDRGVVYALNEDGNFVVSLPTGNVTQFMDSLRDLRAKNQVPPNPDYKIVSDEDVFAAVL